MLSALLLAAAAPATAAPMSAIDAERAFAAEAQAKGQWTAFRAWATDDALMFVPQPTNAQAFLKELKDPAVSVYWWPGRSYVSCDGQFAINTGPWVRGYGKAVGYFTTVWVRQKDGGWKWIYDAGDTEPFARGEGGDIKPTLAACTKAPMPGSPALELAGPGRTGSGASADGSIRYAWKVTANGAREFRAWMWDGKVMQPVITDKVAAQPQ
jgi:hypothetical protein